VLWQVRKPMQNRSSDGWLEVVNFAKPRASALTRNISHNCLCNRSTLFISNFPRRRIRHILCQEKSRRKNLYCAISNLTCLRPRRRKWWWFPQCRNSSCVID
jgi:hypothetical protein